MTCQDYISLLLDLMDGRLLPEEKERVEKHLDVCPACREHYEEIQKMIVNAKKMHHFSVPEDFLPKVMAQIEKKTPLVRTPYFQALGLAAVVLLGCTVWIFLASPDQSTTKAVSPPSYAWKEKALSEGKGEIAYATKEEKNEIACDTDKEAGLALEEAEPEVLAERHEDVSAGQKDLSDRRKAAEDKPERDFLAEAPASKQASKPEKRVEPKQDLLAQAPPQETQGAKEQNRTNALFEKAKKSHEAFFPKPPLPPERSLARLPKEPTPLPGMAYREKKEKARAFSKDDAVDDTAALHPLFFEQLETIGSLGFNLPSRLLFSRNSDREE